MMDSAVTNNYTWVYEFFAFREPGDTQPYGTANYPFRTFSSYDSFRTFAITNAWRMKKHIDDDFEPKYQPSALAEATLYVVIYFSQPPPGESYDQETERNTLFIEKNLGLYHEVTTNDLTDIEPYYLRGVSWIPNLQQFSAEVQTPTGLYQNQWNASTQSWTNTDGKNLVGEIVGKAILFDGCYISPTNHARFSAQMGSLKGTYTQDGPRITPSSLQIRENQLTVSMSKGSDTIIESSINNESWVDEVIIPWSLHTNKAYVPIDMSAPLKLFRARSY
jgi:hypothetical protein